MSRPLRIAIVAPFAAVLCLAAVVRAVAQDDSEGSVEEVVVNQAAGRVVIAVVKSAILIGTTENPIEQGTRPPVPVALSTLRAGTILGAVQWTSPSLQKELGRLDQELPQLRGDAAADAPRLMPGSVDTEASDIEAIGKPLRDRLAALAGAIHGKLEWPENEPLVELVVADYIEGYGPEVWQISYSMDQEQQQGDYWVTNIADPVYLQIWPPEKGQPHTLMEFHYPPDKEPSLLDLLRQKDARLDGLVRGDAKMADTANKFLSGDSMKILPGDATQFLRAALAAITPASEPQTMAIIKQENGFDWILAPPPEPKAPKNQENHTPDAPSLAHPPSDDSEPAPSLAHPPSSR